MSILRTHLLRPVSRLAMFSEDASDVFCFPFIKVLFLPFSQSVALSDFVAFRGNATSRNGEYFTAYAILRNAILFNQWHRFSCLLLPY